MTPDQVKAIQQSFANGVAPISEQAAALFYGRLFEIAPGVKPLFRGDMKEQGRKLMATLGVVVNGLSNLESIARRQRARQASRAIRRQVRRLRTGRRGPAVDARTRPWRTMDAAARRGLGATYGVLSDFMINEAYGRSATAE